MIYDKSHQWFHGFGIQDGHYGFCMDQSLILFINDMPIRDSWPFAAALCDCGKLFHFVRIVSPLRQLRLFSIDGNRICGRLCCIRMQVSVFTFRCGCIQMKWYRIAWIHMLWINRMRLLLLKFTRTKKNKEFYSIRKYSIKPYFKGLRKMFLVPVVVVFGFVGVAVVMWIGLFVIAVLNSDWLVVRLLVPELCCHAWINSVAWGINRMWMTFGTVDNKLMSDYGWVACAVLNSKHSNKHERTTDMSMVRVLYSFLLCIVDGHHRRCCSMCLPLHLMLFDSWNVCRQAIDRYVVVHYSALDHRMPSSDVIYRNQRLYCRNLMVAVFDTFDRRIQFRFLFQSIHHRLSLCPHSNHPNESSCACVACLMHHHFVVYLRYLNPTEKTMTTKTNNDNHSYINWKNWNKWMRLYECWFYRIFLGNTANFKLFSHFNEINEIFIVNMNFAQIHKIQNCAQHITLNAIDEEYRMWAWIFLPFKNVHY